MAHRKGTEQKGELSGPQQAAIAALALFWLFGLFGLIIVSSVNGRHLAGDEKMYWAQSRAVESLGADQLWPPLYSLILRWLGGAGDGLVIQVQLFLLVACCGLLGLIGSFLELPANATAFAASGLFFVPGAASMACFLWPEVFHLFFFLLCLACLLAKSPGRVLNSVAGVALGLALLTKSLLTFFVPFLLAWVVWVAAKRRRWLEPVLFFVALALVTAPTIVENGRSTGRWVIADSSTFNLWLGLTGTSRHSQVDGRPWRSLLEYRASSSDPRKREAILRARVRGEVEERGVISVFMRQLGKQYFLLFDQESTLTEQMPGGRLAQNGDGLIMSPESSRFFRFWSATFHAVLLALFGAGLALAPWRKILAQPGMILLLAYLAYNLLIFLGLHVVSRYLFQILPAMLIFAGFAVEALCSDRRIPLGQRQAALAAAAFMLFLGFGGAPLDRLWPLG